MDTKSYIEWLRSQSMLEQATNNPVRYSGQASQWQHPYADTQAQATAQRASVWFTAYPGAIATVADNSVLHTLADPKLWETFAAIGIDGLHTGPMKRAGGIDGTTFTPTIDGHFDRISSEIDPQFGSIEDYTSLVANAQAQGATIIGDTVPLHSGKGADWRLAERAVGAYPGLYHMVEIPEADWSLLPAVAEGEDSVNLKPSAVDALADKGYIIGRLSRVIFYEEGIKESNWSATAVVEGGDGIKRRWVYLHYFKQGQPVFNWLDQTFAAQRLVVGDILHSLATLGIGILRLDANGFLGIEKRADGSVVSEGHPIAVISNQQLGSIIRKFGGFSFQELNLTLEDIVAMADGGADLSYDFVTRPAYQHALVSGDAGFLRLMMTLMHDYGIEPNRLIHALQNHDELTLELVHFWTTHAEALFTLNGESLTGAALRDRIRATMFGSLVGDRTPYNLNSTTNGIACTTLSIVTAVLGIEDLTTISAEQTDQIKQLHLLLVTYNALQPGIFALSGWDLVGALPLPFDQVADLAADGDTRWINRGGYDLLGNGGSASLPMATALYGSLPDQLADPDSFAAQLQTLLSLRKQYRIAESEQIAIAGDGGLLVMVHKLPDATGWQLTALNFGATAISQTIALPEALSGRLIDIASGETLADLSAATTLAIDLPAYATKLLAILPA